MRPEYNLRELLKGAERGKFYRQYKAGTNVVPLEPDVWKEFPTSKAVNEALRLLIELRNRTGGRKVRSVKRHQSVRKSAKQSV